MGTGLIAKLFRRNRNDSSDMAKQQESHVVWTGPSIRVFDGNELLNSDEMKRDLAAVRQLREKGMIES